MAALSKSRVFITGIAGFTGSHLEKMLAPDFDVAGSVVLPSPHSHHFACDLREEEKLAEIIASFKPDYLIHLAAISFVHAKDQLGIYDVNVFGSENLLKAVGKLNYIPQKIILAGSAAVYGNVSGEISETHPANPVNHYGNSKLAMENIAKPYFEKQNIIITRPFNYTGAGQEKHFVVPKIAAHFKEKKEVIELGNIEVYREFNDIQFTLRCYKELMLSDFRSEIVNVCTGRAYCIRDIIQLMTELSGHKIEVKINPRFVRQNEVAMLRGSNKKLARMIGDFADEFKLRNTLESMLNA